MWKTIIITVSVLVVLCLLFPKIRDRIYGMAKAVFIWLDTKRVELDTTWGKVDKENK